MGEGNKYGTWHGKNYNDMSANEIIKNSVIKTLKEEGVANLKAMDYSNRKLNVAMDLIRKGEIGTIKDLEAYYYGGDIQKVLTTDSSNLVETLYGRRAWDQVNREHTLFSLLPKKIWSRSGWRVITPETADTANYVGENQSIPESDDPTFAKLSVTPASIVRRNEQSDISIALSGLDDGVDETEIALWLKNRHIQIINLELLADADGASTSANRIQPIDRIIGSYAEIAYGKADNSAVLDAGDLDIFGLDRDAAATWSDANVTGQAFGSADATLTLSLLDNTISDIRSNGGRFNPNRKLIITHPETADKIDQLVGANQRFEGLTSQTFITGGINGMQVLGPVQQPGVEGAFGVSTYKGIPIFTDPNVVQDVDLGRIYIIDLDHLFMAMLMTTQFYKYGGPEATSNFNVNQLYRTVGQPVCTNFRKQGKVRDIKST